MKKRLAMGVVLAALLSLSFAPAHADALPTGAGGLAFTLSCHLPSFPGTGTTSCHGYAIGAFVDSNENVHTYTHNPVTGGSENLAASSIEYSELTCGDGSANGNITATDDNGVSLTTHFRYQRGGVTAVTFNVLELTGDTSGSSHTVLAGVAVFETADAPPPGCIPGADPTPEDVTVRGAAAVLQPSAI